MLLKILLKLERFFALERMVQFLALFNYDIHGSHQIFGLTE